MRYRRLGNNGPEVSVVSLGTSPLGGSLWGRVDADEAVATIRASIEAGVNLIDTADSYGSGRAEVLVSQAIAGRRDDILIASKCGIAFQDPDREIDLRAGYVKNAVEQSLVRLATDRIDLLQLHWPDGQPIEEGWRAVVELKGEGKVRFGGVSNFSVGQLERVVPIDLPDSLQSQYSMLWRDDEAEVLPFCERSGIGYLAYAPLAYGMLGGAHRDRASLRDWRSGDGSYGEWDEYRRLFSPGAFERNLQVVARLEEIGRGLGRTLSQVALAWTVARPGVTCAIPGAKRPDQARENAGAGDLELPAEALARIDSALVA